MTDYDSGDFVFANDFRAVRKAAEGDGVLNGLSASGVTSSLLISVSSGCAVIDGTEYSLASGSTFPFTPDGTNPKKALVYMDSMGSVTMSVGTPAVVSPAGASGKATKRPIPPSIPTGAIPISEVWIPANSADGAACTFFQYDEIPSKKDTASYIVWKSGSTYYAKNGATGAVAYTGADAGAVINSALSAISATKGVVRLRADTTYSHATTIDIPEYCTLAGESKYTSILSYTGSGNAVTIAGTGIGDMDEAAAVRNLHITTSTGANGIYAEFATQLEFEDVNISGFSNDGIYAAENCWSAKVERCVFTSCTNAGLEVGDYGNAWEIHATSFTSCGRGIYYHTTEYTTIVSVHQCIFHSSATAHISVNAAIVFLAIEQNYMEATTGVLANGIDVTAATGKSISGGVIKSNLIGACTGYGIRIGADCGSIAIGPNGFATNVLDDFHLDNGCARNLLFDIASSDISDGHAYDWTRNALIRFTQHGVTNTWDYSIEAKQVNIRCPLVMTGTTTEGYANLFVLGRSTAALRGTPSADNVGALVWVTNASTGENLQISDGTNWKPIPIYQGDDSATITVGNTYVAVTHGLGVTPAISDIQITPQGSLLGRTFWVSDVGASTFRINMNTSDTIDHLFSWSAVI